MAKTTIGFGVLLILLGVIAYFGSGMASFTAFIPSFFGVAIAVCGGIALKNPAWTRPALITGVILALVGIAGTLSRLIPAMTGDDGFTLSLATGSQIAFVVIAAVFVVTVIAGGAKQKPLPKPGFAARQKHQ